MNISKTFKKGFTLVELLVVVAIIAIIGAGVAVTYRNLTDKAETAMEMSDCQILHKAISHWSAINDGKLINGLDTLVDDQGILYSPMVDGGGNYGLSGPVGFTFEVRDVPDSILDTLNNAGLDLAYRHLRSRTVANDSTFETGMSPMTGGPSADVLTENTAVLVSSSANKATLQTEAKTIVEAEADGKKKESYIDGNGSQFSITQPELGNKPDGSAIQPSKNFKWIYDTPADYKKDLKKAKQIVNSAVGGRVKMAFIERRDRGIMFPMDQSHEIITNAGLLPEDIVNPDEIDDDGKVAEGVNGRYCLIVMGIGRFASIYNGKSVSVDLPAYAKRSGQSESTYNRYLVVIRVNVGGYDSMTGRGEPPAVVAVLTPQGYSAAKLREKYINDDRNQKD